MNVGGIFLKFFVIKGDVLKCVRVFNVREVSFVDGFLCMILFDDL